MVVKNNNTTRTKQEEEGKQILLSIQNLNSMIKDIMEERKDDFNGTATTKLFSIKQDVEDKNFFHLNR